MTPQAYFEKVSRLLNMSFGFALVRDCCFNILIWCFSFRYWNISFVMLVQMAGEPVSRGFKITSISIFLTGFLANLVVPIMRSIYAFKMDSGSTHEERQAAW